MPKKFNRRNVLKSAGAAFAATASANSVNAEAPTREHNPLSIEQRTEIIAKYRDLSKIKSTIESVGDLILEELFERNIIHDRTAGAIRIENIVDNVRRLDKNAQLTTYYDASEEEGKVKIKTAVEHNEKVAGITIKPEEDISYAVIGNRKTQEENEWIMQNSGSVTTFTDDEVLKSCGDYCQPCPWVGKRNKEITLVFPNIGRTEDRGCGCTTYGYDTVKYCCKDSCCKALCGPVL